VRLAVGLALSAATLVWALRGESLGDIMGHIQRSNVPLLLLAAAAGTGIFPLRARRWRVILDPVAPGLPFGALWRSTAIGMMVSNVLPFRAGEFARAYALTRETDRVPFAAGFASIAVDRAFDAAIVLLLMFAAMLDPRFPAGAAVAGQPVGRLAAVGVTFAVAVLGALYLLVFFPRPLLALAKRIAGVLSARLADRVHALLEAFVDGLAVLRHPARFGAVVWWTLLHWLLNALAYWIGFRAVGIDAPFSAALFLQGVVSIAVVLPTAPGFFGLFEVAGKAGLAVYGVPGGLAVTWAFAFHFLTFIPITVIGATYFSRMGLRLRDVRGGDPETAGQTTSSPVPTPSPRSAGR